MCKNPKKSKKSEKIEKIQGIIQKIQRYFWRFKIHTFGSEQPLVTRQSLSGNSAHLVNAFFEAQVLVTPDDVGDVTPDRQLTDIFGVVGEPVAQFADVEQILDEDGRRSIDGKGQGVRSR